MVHTLKIRKEYADQVLWGYKTFELRKNDRDFKQGDTIEFSVIDADGDLVTFHPTHPLNNIPHEITYVLTDVPEYGLMDGYAILGIKRIRSDWDKVDTATKEISKQVAKLRELVAKHIE